MLTEHQVQPFREAQSLWREVIGDYRFQCYTDKPVVIDAGANSGIATEFIKWQYPGAQVVAIEPNPDTFSILCQKIEKRHWGESVQAINAGLDHIKGQRELIIRRDKDTKTILNWGGSSCDSFYRWDWNSDGNTSIISVPTIRLSDVLTEAAEKTGRVDLLKMDIEGHELVVLTEAEKRLNLVDQIILESHGFALGKEGTREIFRLLTQAGFLLSANEKLKPPFRKRIRIRDAMTQENGIFMIHGKKP